MLVELVVRPHCIFKWQLDMFKLNLTNKLSPDAG